MSRLCPPRYHLTGPGDPSVWHRRSAFASVHRMRHNDFGQPIGEPVPGWQPPAAIRPATLTGRHVRLEPLRIDHADLLHTAMVTDSDPRIWTYYPYSPQMSRAEFGAFLGDQIDRPAAAAYALISPAGAGLGVASFLRNDPANGVVEVGSIVFASVLQRTTAATEALILMARHALGTLGYRRYEWKCDSANAPSIAAARRLGFTYEGRFRQAVVYSGRNRDTDWFSIIDSEWPAISAAYDAWLAPGNFDPAGRQRTRLEDCLAQVGRTPGAPPPPA